MRPRTAAAIVSVMAAVATAACHKPADSDAAFGARVRAFLMAHPEVLEQASAKLQANQDAAAAAAMKQAQANLPKLRAALERDPRDFVANPTGKITVTEFYDYRCPHCANIAPQVVNLIHKDPDVRVVFKEMPIFGATSEHAAYAALAVKKAGGDYLGLYQAYMSARPLDDAAIDRLAIAKGAKAADIAPTAASTAQLASTNALFGKLALDGTPGFVVGDTIIPGEAMDEINAAIARARRSGDAA
jgi:protein-disulfide isomerase